MVENEDSMMSPQQQRAGQPGKAQKWAPCKVTPAFSQIFDALIISSGPE
jgi:hypothetical protein